MRSPQLSTSFPHLGGKRPQIGKFGLLRSCLLLNSICQLCHLVIDRAALCHQLADLAVSVHHCCVIAAAEHLPNFRQREISELAAQIHRDLASIY